MIPSPIDSTALIAWLNQQEQISSTIRIELVKAKVKYLRGEEVERQRWEQ